MNPLARPLARAFIAAHLALYRATRGRIGGRLGRLRILLLTTRGRKSGQPRTAPLVYFEDDARLVIVASNGGSPRDPFWWQNLRETPEASVQIDADVRNVRARLASDAERARLWPRILRENPAYAGYEKQTRRVIPLVLLETC